MAKKAKKKPAKKAEKHMMPEGKMMAGKKHKAEMKKKMK